MSMCETVLGATKSATKPPNTKTWACMYLQEEPSTHPSDEQSGDTNETTNPDEFTKMNAHHTYRFQCIHEFTDLDVVTTLERDLPTTLQDQWKSSRHKLIKSQFPFMTLVDYQFYSYPRHKSAYKEYKCPAYPHLLTFYPGPKLS